MMKNLTEKIYKKRTSQYTGGKSAFTIKKTLNLNIIEEMKIKIRFYSTGFYHFYSIRLSKIKTKKIPHW